MRLQIKVESNLEIGSIESKEDSACGGVKPPVDVQMEACNLSSSCAELRGVIIVTHKQFIGKETQVHVLTDYDAKERPISNA